MNVSIDLRSSALSIPRYSLQINPLTLRRVLQRERVLVRLTVKQCDRQSSRAGSVRDRRVQSAKWSSGYILVRRLRDPYVITPAETKTKRQRKIERVDA